jgi:hypothetical protein
MALMSVRNMRRSGSVTVDLTVHTVAYYTRMTLTEAMIQPESSLRIVPLENIGSISVQRVPPRPGGREPELPFTVMLHLENREEPLFDFRSAERANEFAGEFSSITGIVHRTGKIR